MANRLSRRDGCGGSSISALFPRPHRWRRCWRHCRSGVELRPETTSVPPLRIYETPAYTAARAFSSRGRTSWATFITVALSVIFAMASGSIISTDIFPSAT